MSVLQNFIFNNFEYVSPKGNVPNCPEMTKFAFSFTLWYNMNIYGYYRITSRRKYNLKKVLNTVINITFAVVLTAVVVYFVFNGVNLFQVSTLVETFMATPLLFVYAIASILISVFSKRILKFLIYGFNNPKERVRIVLGVFVFALAYIFLLPKLSGDSMKTLLGLGIQFVVALFFNK